MLLRIFFLLFFFLSPFLSLARYQVCSITINSSDEIETFQEFLSSKDFDFVELLPALENPQKGYNSHWFNEACRKERHCDILVISGHFGGTFFGESGYTLPTELMEEQSCNETCSGILSQVKEIFLFGCNTLASKSKDRRTYEEYLQVLLDDGMARNVAERVVAARYSSLEAPFYERMNFIFSGSHTVYGFNELSPLGPHIRNPLKKYFRSINEKFGSYANYLDSESYKREENIELFRHLPRNVFTLNQARISLSHEDEEQKIFFENKCLLYDKNISFSSRMQALENIFHSGKSGSAFFAIDHFLSNNKKDIQEGIGRGVFRSIRTNESLAKEFISYEKDLNPLPFVRMIFYSLLDKFQWKDPFDLFVQKKLTLLDIIKPADQEAYSSVLTLLEQKQIVPGELYVSKEDLSKDYVNGLWSLLIFEKLRVIAPDWQKDILKHCETESINKKIGMCYQALNTLAHIWPEAKTIDTLEDLLNSSDEGVLYYSLRALGQTSASGYETHRKIADFLFSNSATLRKEAIEVLGFLKTPYEDVQSDLTSLLLQASDELSKELFWSLKQINITGGEAQKHLLKYIERPDLKSEFFIETFRIFENSNYFSDSTLYYFYEILERREKKHLELLFAVIETLSKNTNIKDIGIHYRFLAFKEEKDLGIKKKALESMLNLKWLHPEIQLSFLKYFEDSDSKVRQLAFQVLRNVENLQDSTLKKITELSSKSKELKSLL
ncbi:MAG: HEAT repeat domain-containing protein [Bdellovibrionales bacterium]|nr:HEAT repeat domain-containing protein [Bdellovibrionales bacterium]